MYRHSIVAGGVYSPDEFQAATRADVVVDRHYSVFDRASVRVAHNDRDRLVYVSFRVGDQVYWSRNRVKLPAGEPILTDGRNEARARCGNRVSSTPQQPVAPPALTPAGEDPGGELELTSSGIGSETPPAPGATTAHGPAALLTPEIFAAPDLPAIAVSGSSEPDWIFSGLGSPPAFGAPGYGPVYSPGRPGEAPPPGGGSAPPGGTPPTPPPSTPIVPPPPFGGVQPAPSLPLPIVPGFLPPELVVSIEYNGNGTATVSPLLPPSTTPLPSSGSEGISPDLPPTITFPSGTPGGEGSNPSPPSSPPGSVLPPRPAEFPPPGPVVPIVREAPEPDPRFLVGFAILASVAWRRLRRNS